MASTNRPVWPDLTKGAAGQRPAADLHQKVHAEGINAIGPPPRASQSEDRSPPLLQQIPFMAQAKPEPFVLAAQQTRQHHSSPASRAIHLPAETADHALSTEAGNGHGRCTYESSAT